MIVKDISYKNLQLAIIAGAPDLSRMNIFKETKIQVTDLSIEIHAAIIGTSHFVQIKNDSSKIFTEVLACHDIEKEPSKQLYFKPLREINSTVNIDMDFSYQFTYDHKSYKNTFEEISEWAVNEKQINTLVFLEHQFEIGIGNTPSSRTILSIKSINNGIRVKTIHEYQEEDALIVSESLLKF